METITVAEKVRYPVPTHVRLRQETANVIAKYAEMLSTPTKKVYPADAHRALLDIACAQVSGLLGIKFRPEEAPLPSLSTVRRRKAAGVPVPGPIVARARKVAKQQAAARRKSTRDEGAA